jgi:hypothetical protein
MSSDKKREYNRAYRAEHAEQNLQSVKKYAAKKTECFQLIKQVYAEPAFQSYIQTHHPEFIPKLQRMFDPEQLQEAPETPNVGNFFK